MPRVEQQSDRIARFDEYKEQLAFSINACKAKCDQFNKLMFTISELLSSGIDSVRDRKQFNFNHSMAIEAAYGILNSVTKPPADRPHEARIVLLIKFASVFVPFMEELNGYYARPDPTVLEQQRLKQERERIEHNNRVMRQLKERGSMQRKRGTRTNLGKSQIKQALNLSAPPIEQAAFTFRPVPTKNSAFNIGLRDAAVIPPSAEAPGTQPCNSSYPFVDEVGAVDVVPSQPDPPWFSEGVVKEEGTAWIKEEEPEHEEHSPTNPSPYIKDEQMDEIKEEPMEEPIADRIVIKSTREMEEEEAAEIAAMQNSTRSSTKKKPVAKRREMRLSTFAKHHYPEMVKKSGSQKRAAPSQSHPTREKKQCLGEALPVARPPKMVPKAKANRCRYCNLDCGPSSLESHVKSNHKDHWLKFVKKCPEKECDFRSDKDEEINNHQKEVHNGLYNSWKLVSGRNRFKLQSEFYGVKKKCPFCPEPLLSLSHFVGHMELYHRRLCSYENPILECANASCKHKTARCHEMFEHWHKVSPGCKFGLKFDYEEAKEVAEVDIANKREEYGLESPPPSAEPDQEQGGAVKVEK